jgi:hypothetical protein
MSVAAAKRFFAMRSSWLGAGGQPVADDLAQHRADVCIKCPMNQWTLLGTVLNRPVATLVKQQIALKHAQKLKVENQDKLYACQACQCVLDLKVWVPIEFIKETTPTTELHPDCWILDELK